MMRGCCCDAADDDDNADDDNNANNSDADGVDNGWWQCWWRMMLKQTFSLFNHVIKKVDSMYHELSTSKQTLMILIIYGN